MEMGALAGGYSQTKWAAERLVEQAAQAGLPTAVYRLGRLTGDSRTGAANTGDLFYRLLAACAKLQCFPEISLSLDMTPVDYAAGGIAALMRQPASRGRAFHLFNPQPAPLGEVAEALSRRGHSLEPVSVEVFADRLQRSIRAGELESLAPLAPLLAAAPAGTFREVPFDDAGTRAGLAGTGINCPPADSALLDRYFEYLVRTGFLTHPSTEP